MATYEPFTPPSESSGEDGEAYVVNMLTGLVCTSFERPAPNEKKEYRLAFLQGRQLIMGDVKECFFEIEKAKLMKKEAREREKNKPPQKGIHRT